MNKPLHQITDEEIKTYILPFIPKPKRGFESHYCPIQIFKCIFYKLKTGVQWRQLFMDMPWATPPFSWQTVYHFYRKWIHDDVFIQAFLQLLIIKKDTLDTSILH